MCTVSWYLVLSLCSVSGEFDPERSVRRQARRSVDSDHEKATNEHPGRATNTILRLIKVLIEVFKSR